MRTSLNEIKLIDGHLFDHGDHEDALLFDAMLLIDAGLPEKIMWQKKAHAIVHQYGRKKLKAEIESVHQKLFSGPLHYSFKQKILSLFFKQ